MTGAEIAIIALGVAVGFVVVRLLIGSTRQRPGDPEAEPSPPPSLSTLPPGWEAEFHAGELYPPIDPRFQDHLSRVVLDHGPFVGADPKRLEGLLLDYALGRYRAEIRATVAAARCGVPAILYGGGSAAVPRAVAAMQSLAGREAALSDWAVRSWAAALAPVGALGSESRQTP